MPPANDNLMKKLKSKAKAIVRIAKTKAKVRVQAAKAKAVMIIQKAKEKVKKYADKMAAKAIVDAAKAKARSAIDTIISNSAIAIKKAKAKAKKYIGGQEETGAQNLLEAEKAELLKSIRRVTTERTPSPSPPITFDQGIYKAVNYISNINIIIDGTDDLEKFIKEYYINFKKTYNIDPTHVYTTTHNREIMNKIFCTIITKYLQKNRLGCEKRTPENPYTGKELISRTINKLQPDIVREYGTSIMPFIMFSVDNICMLYDTK